MEQDARSAFGQYGLEREYVTSTAVWERESSQIFQRHWVCVGRVEELGVNGVRPFVWEGQQLLAVCGDDVICRVFRNVCRHRGSLLVQPEECSAVGQRLQCPYHAWTYDRKGCLRAAPNMENVPGFEAKDLGLLEIPSAVVAGFLWINFAPQNSAAEFLEPMANVFAAWQLGELVVATELKYVVKANWKLLFQNYSECYHCPTVHPALNRLTPYLGSSNELVSGPILGGPMQLAAGVGTMSEDGELVGSVIPSLDPLQKRQVSYFTVFPNVFLSVHPDYVLIHRLQRLSNRETEVVCQFLFQKQDRELLNFDPLRAVRFWDLTNRQDWEVCERTQLGMEDVGYCPGPYSNLESVVAAFDRHYLASLGDFDF